MLNLIKTPIKDNKEPNIVKPFLCDKIKQFGFCQGPCTERHSLCKTLDKDCLNIPIKCFIKIQLTKILSASHFYGRILKYSTSKDPTKDQDWTIYHDSFERIKSELRNVGSSLNTKTVCTNPVVGEMVMVETEQKEMLRAIILAVVRGWFSVRVKAKLIDMGHTEEFSSNKVFVLPSHLKNFRPVAVEVIISSMEPLVEDSDTILNWPATTTKCVRSLLEPMILIDVEFVCKVALTLGTTLWIDWLLVKKCVKCTHFACKLYKNAIMLPRELINRNLAKDSSTLIDKLMNLDKDVHLWRVNLSADKSKNISNKKSNIQLFSCEEQKIKTDEEIIIQWAHLSNDILYHVSVIYVEDPKCILVTNLKFYDRIDALQKDIDDAINNDVVEQLTCVTEGTVCLAASPEDNSKYNRVVIKNIEDSHAVIFYVDYGGIYQVNVESLLTLPTRLITKLPFQVIECKLSGYNDILDADIVGRFANHLFQLTNTPISLKVLTSSTDSKLTGGNSYEVVLFDNNTNINVTLANQYKMYVDNTQIQNILSSNYKYDKLNDVDKDDEFHEDLKSQLDLLESLMNMSTKNVEKPIEELSSNNLSQDNNVNKSVETDDKQIDAINVSQDKVENKSIEIDEKRIEKSVSINLNQDLVTNNNKKKNQKYCLDCNVTPVIPQCFWHQNKEWIYLKLNILSVINYNYSHTVDSITISVKTNSVSYFFTTVLYAYITKESFTCHVTFDGIHIKAQKLVQVIYRWPRLMKCSKKHKYILYDTEYISAHKDLKVFVTMVDKYKMMALGTPVKQENYDCDFDDSDDDPESYSVFED